MILTTWSDKNKQTTNGLSIRYFVVLENGYFKLTRTASKSYSYLGMTLETARSCAQSKRLQYLRPHAFLQTVTDGQMPTQKRNWDTQANITVYHERDNTWGVSIEVDEIDYNVSRNIPTNPKIYFATEDSWDYDQETWPEYQRINTDLSALSDQMITNSALDVYYDIEHMTTPSADYYVLTRYANKQYLFHLMNEVKALSVAHDKAEMYTRQYTVLKDLEDDEQYPQTESVVKCTTQITPVHTEGKFWEVDITVSEEDQKAVKTIPSSKSALSVFLEAQFYSENQRDYDQISSVN